MLKQPSSRAFPNPWDFAQLGGAVTDLPALAVEGHSKTVGLITDQLNQMAKPRNSP